MFRSYLEYQIWLCSASCVGKVSHAKHYQSDVPMMSLLLSSKDKKTL
ncbi:MAG: hypothetical protein H0A74_01010 [Candidatus Vesicomyosocius endoextente]|uniref:Uncharacterized protein n=1 Tax=Candidatus Vesicomyosocius endoextente TaxID=2738853 RepID=A0A853G7P9_9GAMM|nr:hypothetical protein [Candidatus Vesicomyosocius endoextente]